MDIKVETGYDSGHTTIDISIMGMDITSLPLLNGDEIREMSRPIIENKIALETGNRERARKISRLLVYGEQRYRELFPEDFSDGTGSQNGCPQPPAKEEDYQVHE